MSKTAPSPSADESWAKKPAAFSWFPPHMHRAQKRLLAEVKTVDLVVEIRDARLPRLSANPALHRIVADRARLVVFNKSSLADPKLTRRWRRHFEDIGTPALFLDAETGNGPQRVADTAKEMLKHRWDTLRKRGIRPPPPRLMVIGIPNVGKSTLINRLIGRKRQEVGPNPGVTRASVWVPLKERMALLDSPGVLLPRIEELADAFRLGWIGAVPDALIGPERLAVELLSYLLHHDAAPLRAEYSIPEFPLDAAVECLDAIAKARGMLQKGARTDRDRAASLLLRDFRRGALGRFTFDSPPRHH